MEPRRMNVCRECVLALRQSRATATRRLTAATQPLTTRSSRASTTTASSSSSPSRSLRPRQHIQHYATESRPKANISTPERTLDLNAIHTRIQELSASVLNPDANGGDVKLPSEQRVLYVFEQLQSIAASILEERGPERASKPGPAKEGAGRRRQETATSALLGSVNARQYPAFISKASILNMLSEKAHEIVRHPHVFITSPVLKAYVELQSTLQQPWSFPDIFDAYARKPAPTMAGNLVEYKPVSPNHINAAIDPQTANTALSAAMLAHNLPLAIDVITASFCTPAFKRAKALRQAALPVGGLAVAPLAAYTLSSSFSSFQQTMDPSLATGVAFAGIMTYVGAVGMVGYVAITTANDQMDRVTWASGVPLWERWVREDERAAADRLAAAWGFKDRDKRGEEEGDDWETLREWVGQRGMVLDRVNLMEGME